MNKQIVVSLCLGLLGGLPTAQASEPTVVILPPVHNLPGDAERVNREVVEQLTTSLQGAGYSVLPSATARECGPAAGTIDAAALAAAANRCEAQAALGLDIDASAMGYNLHLVLVGFEGTAVSDQQATCDFCTEQEMIAKWGELGSGAGAPPATLVAAAAEDGEPVPDEPDDDPPVPVIVDEPGSSFGIADVPWWFWAGAGTSLALSLGVGLPLILIDGEPTCDGPLESCPDLYDTDALGYTFLAVGIAGLAAVGVGLYLVIADDESEGEAETEAAPAAGIALVPGPGGLVLHGFF